MTKKQIDPTILIIFGATGDLSRTRLIPALYHLYEHKLLPKILFVVGSARRELSFEKFRNYVEPKNAKKEWQKFAKQIFYLPGNFADNSSFQNLAQFLHNLETKGHSCANRLFYYSTLPSHYETISRQLDEHGLLLGCTIHKRKTRVIIEKPFGQDLKSARRLDQTLNQYFSENQIYRIDHFLGKETVQNLLTVRFANSIFEPIWNRNFIDHVQISALEDVGIGARGAYYEEVGALRDVVQNHLMQLLALTAMEPPLDLSTKSIRDERVKVIEAIQRPTAKLLPRLVTVGQYQGYRQEPNISPNSRTETFVALKLFIGNARWLDIPFYLRTGKRLNKKTTQISIHFKPQTQFLFEEQKLTPNVLTFKIQPNEGIYLSLMAKHPGFGIRLHPVTMGLGYQSAFGEELPEAYERLLLDFMEEDQRLFARKDEIEYSWKYIDVLEDYLITRKKIKIYPAGSSGPKEVEDLIKRDKRQWYIV